MRNQLPHLLAIGEAVRRPVARWGAPPGEILLEDYIKPMAVSVRAVALALHVPYSRLGEITKGERGVTADTALRVERYFGSEAQGWLNLQSAYALRSDIA